LQEKLQIISAASFLKEVFSLLDSISSLKAPLPFLGGKKILDRYRPLQPLRSFKEQAVL